MFDYIQLIVAYFLNITLLNFQRTNFMFCYVKSTNY